MLTLTTPPAGEPLDLPGVKAALRIETDAEDTVLERMISAARHLIERRLDLALLAQTWTLSLAGVPAAPVPLRPGKVARITGGTVRYEGEAPRDLADGEARLVRSWPARVAFDLKGAHAVTELTVEFEAGWPAAASVPPGLVHALHLLVAHYYEERQLFAEGRYVPVPASLDAHLAAFREVRL